MRQRFAIPLTLIKGVVKINMLVTLALPLTHVKDEVKSVVAVTIS